MTLHNQACNYSTASELCEAIGFDINSTNGRKIAKMFDSLKLEGYFSDILKIPLDDVNIIKYSLNLNGITHSILEFNNILLGLHMEILSRIIHKLTLNHINEKVSDVLDIDTIKFHVMRDFNIGIEDDIDSALLRDIIKHANANKMYMYNKLASLNVYFSKQQIINFSNDFVPDQEDENKIIEYLAHETEIKNNRFNSTFKPTLNSSLEYFYANSDYSNIVCEINDNTYLALFDDSYIITHIGIRIDYQNYYVSIDEGHIIGDIEEYTEYPLYDFFSEQLIEYTKYM